MSVTVDQQRLESMGVPRWYYDKKRRFMGDGSNITVPKYGMMSVTSDAFYNYVEQEYNKYLIQKEQEYTRKEEELQTQQEELKEQVRTGEVTKEEADTVLNDIKKSKEAFNYFKNNPKVGTYEEFKYYYEKKHGKKYGEKKGGVTSWETGRRFDPTGTRQLQTTQASFNFRDLGPRVKPPQEKNLNPIVQRNAFQQVEKPEQVFNRQQRERNEVLVNPVMEFFKSGKIGTTPTGKDINIFNPVSPPTQGTRTEIKNIPYNKKPIQEIKRRNAIKTTEDALNTLENLQNTGVYDLFLQEGKYYIAYSGENKNNNLFGPNRIVKVNDLMEQAGDVLDYLKGLDNIGQKNALVSPNNLDTRPSSYSEAIIRFLGENVLRGGIWENPISRPEFRKKDTIGWSYGLDTSNPLKFLGEAFKGNVKLTYGTGKTKDLILDPLAGVLSFADELPIVGPFLQQGAREGGLLQGPNVTPNFDTNVFGDSFLGSSWETWKSSDKEVNQLIGTVGDRTGRTINYLGGVLGFATGSSSVTIMETNSYYGASAGATVGYYIPFIISLSRGLEALSTRQENNNALKDATKISMGGNNYLIPKELSNILVSKKGSVNPSAIIDLFKFTSQSPRINKALRVGFASTQVGKSIIKVNEFGQITNYNNKNIKNNLYGLPFVPVKREWWKKHPIKEENKKENKDNSGLPIGFPKEIVWDKKNKKGYVNPNKVVDDVINKNVYGNKNAYGLGFENKNKYNNSYWNEYANSFGYGYKYAYGYGYEYMFKNAWGTGFNFDFKFPFKFDFGFELPSIQIPKAVRKKVNNKGYFDVFLKKKGKFVDITPTPLTYKNALNLGALKAGKSLSASFKIVPTSSKGFNPMQLFKANKKKIKGPLSDFRNYKIRKGQRIKTPNLFIEKRNKRLNTFNEVLNIQQSRRKKKKRGGVSEFVKKLIG